MQTGPRGSDAAGSNPKNPTGRLYAKQLAEAADKKKIQQDPCGAVREAREAGHKAGFDLGFSQGYAQSAEAGLIAGWDDAVEFFINAGLVTLDAVDAAVDAYNAKLAVADQSDTAPGED
jgi:flagellar biosynthesis/type III secretory pathway protein FliH